MPVKKILGLSIRYNKRTIRFIAFFIFLVIFAIVEDITVVVFSGAQLNLILFVIILIIASLFTGIAEFTEKFVKEKKGEKIKKFIKKEERKIKKRLEGK